jgi:hypothetical protein
VAPGIAEENLGRRQLDGMMLPRLLERVKV